MLHGVEISTGRYEQAHHRKPRGYRLWYFALPGDTTFCFTGTYGEARRAAAVAASRRYRHPVTLQVCA